MVQVLSIFLTLSSATESKLTKTHPLNACVRQRVLKSENQENHSLDNIWNTEY